MDHNRYSSWSVQVASPTGERIEVEAIGIFRVADGWVVESWDKYDTLGLWQ